MLSNLTKAEQERYVLASAVATETLAEMRTIHALNVELRQMKRLNACEV